MNINKHKTFESEVGCLLPIEFFDLEIEPRRIFIVKDVPVGVCRGDHAHYENIQILYCIKGKIEVVLFDGVEEEIGLLNENEYVLVDKLIWDSQKFVEENSVLLVISSTSYDKDDYIFDKEEFIKIKQSICQK